MDNPRSAKSNFIRIWSPQLRRQFLVVAVFMLVLNVASSVYAIDGISTIGDKIKEVGDDLVQYVIPAIAFLAFIWAGIKVLHGSREAIPWAFGALAGTIIALNAEAIASWLTGG